MLSKQTDHVKPRLPLTPGGMWRCRHECIYYMNVGELIEATFPVTLEMPFPDYLTPMLNPMSGKILQLEKKQATEEKKEFTIWDIMEERPHSAICNNMYLVLIGL